MATTNVPVKTPKAMVELGARQRKLSQRHRTVLFLVDGRRSEAQVRQMAIKAGSPATLFDELLAQGMIALPPFAVPSTRATADDAAVSVLPASLALLPSVHDSILNEPQSSDMGELDSKIEGQDDVVEEARMILMRAVREQAPVAGSLTLLRLRRASSRRELEELLDEVELRITKPFQGLRASQTLSRVRELLSTQVVS